MARLPTSYRDWLPDGNGLQYRIGTTSQGNSSITDVTSYAQQGNEWQASILNGTNTEVNALQDRASAIEANARRIDGEQNAKISDLYDRVDKVRYRDGKFYPIQAIFFMLYERLKQNPLTAEEYQNLGLTAWQYRSFDISAFNYDDNGKSILHRFDYLNPINAAEYQALDLTAQQYRDKGLTAYDYATNAKTLLSE